MKSEQYLFHAESCALLFCLQFQKWLKYIFLNLPLGSWKVFRVILAGRTNGAHRSIVQKLKDIGQTEETSREESDYCVVFCPVVSRVGTDIAEALDKLPCKKKTKSEFL